MRFDVIVIGSGFGGAITGCRLAEAGYRTLILERGRRWDRTSYPREPGDAWLWNDDEGKTGWLEFRRFETVSVLSGAGVGGGSLTYANVAAEVPPAIFSTGWPSAITAEELEPFYRRVDQMMNVQTVPPRQRTWRSEHLPGVAQDAGETSRLKQVRLAVSFDPAWGGSPCLASESRSFLNAEGIQQGTCVNLGECTIGCPVDAKNTLNFNYVPRAERHGAEVRPLHRVTDIEPVSGGYRVVYERIDRSAHQVGSETARMVIVSAGSMGSTELLLRCRDVTRSLPGLSSQLGNHWSANGFFFLPVIYRGLELGATSGPTITRALDFLDGSVDGQRFLIEDGGFPRLLMDYLIEWATEADVGTPLQWAQREVRSFLQGQDAGFVTEFGFDWSGVIAWLAQGVDPGNGTMRLSREKAHLSWDIRESFPLLEAMLKTVRRLGKSYEPHLIVPFAASPPTHQITPHPLGGCRMADTPNDGVVDHLGEVFGYPNLYVVDGSIVPRPLGVNPSHVIAALAERMATSIARGERESSKATDTAGRARETLTVPTGVEALAPGSLPGVSQIPAQSATGASPARERSQEVTVYFATDRKRVATQSMDFGAERNESQALHFGTATVRIPQDHRLGKVERPTIWTLWRERPDQHFVITRTSEQGEDEFFAGLRGVIQSSTAKQALVFIHGYNVTFAAAVYRTAQLAYDLEFDGASILYSWPSEGRAMAYPVDLNNNDWTVPHLRAFLEDLSHRSGAQAIHLVAHSMGNRALVNALIQMNRSRTGPVFNQLALTAPDIDASVFQELASHLKPVVAHATLYASSNDLALAASRRYQRYQRAGDTSPAVLVVSGIDTIDVSNVDTALLGHCYYGDNRSVISDLFYLLQGLPPHRRATLRPARCPAGAYWVFQP